MRRNIVNHQEIRSLLSNLIEKRPKEVHQYIERNVKNYLYKKSKTSLNLWWYFKSPENQEDKVIKDNGGPYYTVDINEQLYKTIYKALDYIENVYPIMGEKIYNIGVLDAVFHHDKELEKNKKETNNGTIELNNQNKELKFKNGYYLIELISPEEREAEGKNMGHCLSGRNYKTSKIYSLRDSLGRSLLTFEVYNTLVMQISGKNNAEVPKELYPFVSKILRHFNWHVQKDNSQNLLQKTTKSCLFIFLVFKWKEVIAWIDPDVSETIFSYFPVGFLEFIFMQIAFMNVINIISYIGELGDNVNTYESKFEKLMSYMRPENSPEPIEFKNDHDIIQNGDSNEI